MLCLRICLLFFAGESACYLLSTIFFYNACYTDAHHVLFCLIIFFCPRRELFQMNLSGTLAPEVGLLSQLEKL
jgi:hypothetical protein